MAVWEIPYCVKWLLALVMMVLGVVVLVVVFKGNGGDASVVMQGEKDTSNIHESNGFHLVELTEGDTECGQFSWSEWALMGLGVVLVLKVSHVVHYCYFTKRIEGTVWLNLGQVSIISQMCLCLMVLLWVHQ